jgi:LysM repeat protein
MHYIVRGGDTLSRIAATHGTTLQALLDANPHRRADPDRIGVGEVLRLPTFQPAAIGAEAPAPGKSAASLDTTHVPAGEWWPGALSSKYETGGRGPSTVSSGAGDAGGVSYGSYQMTCRPGGGTVGRFVGDPRFPWRERFAGLLPGEPAFTNAWRALATAEPAALAAAEHTFIRETHFQPLVRKIRREDGLDVASRSQALQDVIWSTAVQHGPATSVVHNACVAIGLGASGPLTGPDLDRRLIVAIYAERGRRDGAGRLVHFRRNSPIVQDGVARRFVAEQEDALRLLASAATMPAQAIASA